MRKLHLINGLVLATVMLAGCSSMAPVPAAASASQLDAVVTQALDTQRYPGLAVAVVQQGKVLSAKGYGLANIEHQVPVTTQTMFQTASLAKQFTAVAVMLLVEDGKLRLDDPVSRFLPGTPASWQSITIRHLLTHTAGIPDYEDGKLDLRKDYTEAELVQFAFGLPLEFVAGERFSYSNTAYVLLGVIVHQVSGQFYADVLRERVFAPLGMQTAQLISEENIVMHRAAGYRLVADTVKNQQWVAPKLNTTADGSLYLSLQDWLVWQAAIRRQAVLRPSSWQQVFAPVRLNNGTNYPYGLGWELDDGRGPARYGHTGAWQGFTTAYLHLIEPDLTVIALGNMADADPQQVVEQVAALYWRAKP